MGTRIAASCVLALALASTITAAFACRTAAAQGNALPYDLLEELPRDVVASMEVRDRGLAAMVAAQKGEQGFEAFNFVVTHSYRWWPGGSVLTVAFKGGDPALHAKIAEAVRQIDDAVSLSFDFGFDAPTGTYRTWKITDTEHAASIRISLDRAGYFSLVGTDSVNGFIGSPAGAVGGRPGQRSLNLQGFDQVLPLRWKRIVRHEFLHALGVLHEHQSEVGPCAEQFRWDDDEGCVPRTDADGRYVNDGPLRPGLYTFLGGYPNHWDRATVDHNQRPVANAITGPFDRDSIMLYRFPDTFYREPESHCAPTAERDDLSPGDVAGLELAYGADASFLGRAAFLSSVQAYAATDSVEESASRHLLELKEAVLKAAAQRD